jgi:hypothetical protein
MVTARGRADGVWSSRGHPLLQSMILGAIGFFAQCPVSHAHPSADLVRRVARTLVDFGETGMTGIEINWSSLKDSKPHEYAVRFLFGGLATVVAGLIARKYGTGHRRSFPRVPGDLSCERHADRKPRKETEGCNRSRWTFARAYGRESGFVRGLVGLWVSLRLLMCSGGGLTATMRGS